MLACSQRHTQFYEETFSASNDFSRGADFNHGLLWFGQDRKQATLDRYFEEETTAEERRGLVAACVDMWEPFTRSILSWAPACRIVFDKFHVMQHANRAVDEVRRAEFFRKGKESARW